MTDLSAIKKKVSAALLKKVEGVSGVGLPEQRLTIYLDTDTAEVREAVAKAVASLKLTVPLHWQVTGTFERQSFRPD